MTSKETVAEALAEYPVFDGHNDLVTNLRGHRGYCVAGLDKPSPEFHTDLPRLRQGGVGAQFWSAWVPSTLPEPQAVVATIEQIDAIHRLIAAYPSDLAFATSADEVRAAWTQNKIASLIGVEGGHSIGNSLAVLRAFKTLGVRYLTLTHNDNNAWADSATDKPIHDGLTAGGRAVVTELNRLGILVDLSHTSADTQRAAIAASKAPVLFSHSSAFAVNAHPRNVPDDVLELLKVNGGVVQAVFLPSFVSKALYEWEKEARESVKTEHPDFSGFWKPAPLPGETYAERQAINDAPTAVAGNPPGGFFAALAEFEKVRPKPKVGIADVVEHIEHLREVAGIDHIGLGGDYDGTLWQPEGLEDVSTYPNLLEALADRGWSSHELAKLAGGNVLRVLGDAETHAE
ncbi:MAG: dipeptidase [Propionibacteriaceae bacterium]|jgi:membrane dipeptidase|nr:dipeptidase [Propionibacteriaceae bacterium]